MISLLAAVIIIDARDRVQEQGNTRKTDIRRQKERKREEGVKKSRDLEDCVGVRWILESWLVEEKQIGN